MSNTPDKPKPSLIVQELCEKLKIQLDQLGVMADKKPEVEAEKTQRKDLFKALQDQLNDLSR